MANESWDQEYDVVVVGSGAGGMTAALCAQAQGLTATVIEKSDLYGGTSAVSGGGIWIPCNDEMPKDADSEAEALKYLKHLTVGEVPEAKLKAYVRNAREMVRYLAKTFGIRFHWVKGYPDYFCDQPGGKTYGRTMEPETFDARKVGDDLDLQREPYRGTLVMGRMSMTQVEAHTLMCRAPGWIWLTMKMMLRYWFDFAWRKRTWRDRRMALGQAMVGSLRVALRDRKVPLQLSTALESLVTERGRVTGVVATQNGKTLRIGARKAVVLASGGFESNQQMREQYLPKPTRAEWTIAPGVNHGDGIRAGQAAGGALKFMDLTWGCPSILSVPGKPGAGIFIERQLPGCVMVNSLGQRFVNEAAPYTEVIYAMYRDHAKTGASVPCWMIFDARFRYSYPLGPLLPAQIQPDKVLPADWLGRVYWKADTIGELAKQIGIDGTALAQTVAKINGFADTGKDPEFGKGSIEFDRYYGDPNIKPNPCLAPIVKAPFYAMRLDAGEIGTKGGLVTDERARVLREDGSVIEGLYAAGNCSAAVMGRTYAGAGATLGPAMTFAYLAALDIAAQAAAPRAGMAAAA